MTLKDNDGYVQKHMCVRRVRVRVRVTYVAYVRASRRSYYPPPPPCPHLRKSHPPFPPSAPLPRYGGMGSHFVDEMTVRARLTSEQTFYDLGSGIGQIPLQVAATTGARSIGVEMDQPRHEMAVKIMAAYIKIMRAWGIGMGPFGESMSDLVRYIQGDMKQVDVLNESDVMFFNNYRCAIRLVAAPS